MSQKCATTEAGVRTAAKWIAPVFGAAAVPMGVRTSLYGYGLAGAARDVRPDIEKTQDIAAKFTKRFGEDAIKDYDKFDPKGETYGQWRRLRKLKFLEPYIRSGHEGLTSMVTPRRESMDIVRSLRHMTGTWKDYHTRHYEAFTRSPRAALKVLSLEGMEETKARGLKRALESMLKDYDVLAAEHGPYEGLRRLYNEPWAKVSLRSPASVKRFTDKYGNDALEDARKKQALLFYASKSKLYAPKFYGALTAGTSLAGHGMGLGGAAAVGIGGYNAIKGLANLLMKRGEAEMKIPPGIDPANALETEDSEEVMGPVSALLAGANPFSMKVDVMGVPFKPESRKEELKRVLPAVLGKGLVGALVVPAMARSGVEAVRGLAKQGPYAKLPGGRLRAGAAGAIYGTAIPARILLRAFRTGSTLKAMERGVKIPPARLKQLADQLGEAPIRAGGGAKTMQEAIKAGVPISPELARRARQEMFEPNVTIMLNALLGGSLTGYAGYAAYARGKRLREAFEQVYGKELPPEIAAVIMDPAKLRMLAKARRETMRSERRQVRRSKMEGRRRDKREKKRA